MPPSQRSDKTLMEVSQCALDSLYIRNIWLLYIGMFFVNLIWYLYLFWLNKHCLGLSLFQLICLVAPQQKYNSYRNIPYMCISNNKQHVCPFSKQRTSLPSYRTPTPNPPNPPPPTLPTPPHPTPTPHPHPHPPHPPPTTPPTHPPPPPPPPPPHHHHMTSNTFPAKDRNWPWCFG